MKRSQKNRHVFFVTIFISATLIVVFGLLIIFLSNVNKDTALASYTQNSSEEIEIDLSPEINLIGDETIKVNSIDEFQEPGYTADDDVDGDITSLVQTSLTQIDDYNYQIEYNVSDSSGNEVSKIRKIRIIVGVVCLTFDDGPSLEITPQILDILKEKNVQATFFINGFDDEKADLVKREYSEGNVVGLHGYSHDYSQIYTSIDNLMNNFYKLEDLVRETIGVDSKIIRFPGGTSNTVSREYCECIMTEAVQRVSDEGYIYVDWNVDSNDAGSDWDNSEKIYNNVIQELKHGRTNVVLMHDRKEKQATADALPNIIDYCISNGYDLQTITSETPINSSQHHPKN